MILEWERVSSQPGHEVFIPGELEGNCHSSDPREQILCEDAVQDIGWGHGLWVQMESRAPSPLRSL